MNALIIGYGSIGKRHARILDQLGLNIAVASRRQVDHPNCFPDIQQALDIWNPEYIVISSQTHEHYRDFSILAEAGFAGVVLIEKPLFHEPRAIPENIFSRAYVAFNLRFHPVLKTLRAIVNGKKKIAAHSYVGQYLPKWRPKQDYRLGYSADRNRGGGVLRDLSHELDYLTWMLGKCQKVAALGGQFSHLQINSDDVYSILFKTNDCPIASLALNYLDDSLHRDVVIFTEDGTARANFVSGTVSFREKEELQINVDIDTTYLAQHKAVLQRDETALCNLDAGLGVSQLINAIETANQTGVWVELRD